MGEGRMTRLERTANQRVATIALEQELREEQDDDTDSDWEPDLRLGSKSVIGCRCCDDWPLDG